MPRLASLLTIFACACAAEPEVGADAVEHCYNRETTVCLRERVAGRITEAELESCSSAVPTACAEALWPESCTPTPAESDECIRLLRQNSLLTTEELLAMSEVCELCP